MQSRSPLRASPNRRQEGGAHPGSLPGEQPTWDAPRFPGNICPAALPWTPRAGGRRRGAGGAGTRRGRASAAGFRSPPLGAALLLLPCSSEKEGGGCVR